MTIGIYKLTFTDGSFYIGRSVNIEERYKDHCSMLKRKKSTCPKVQKKFNELGTLPTVDILEVTVIDKLSEKECIWIHSMKAVVEGLNILPGGTDMLVGDEHPQSKYSNEQILHVVTLLSSNSPMYSHSEIESLTSVKATTIKDIICSKSHLWVREKHPELYAEMLLTKPYRKINSVSNLNPQANKKTVNYPLVISPEGLEYNIEHLSNFAKEHGLQASNLSHVLSGRREHHKGWRLKQ